MKFKASLSSDGLILLERRFLPAFEKLDKVCHLLMTPDEWIFLHNVISNAGIQAMAQIPKHLLFEEYQIESMNRNRIAFTVDVSLLSQALRSIQVMEVEKLQIKLVKKLSSSSSSSTALSMPYFSFQSKGVCSFLIQDVPLSLPLSPFDLHDLVSAIDLFQFLPRMLIQTPSLSQLQLFIEKIKNISEIIEIGMSQFGHFLYKVDTSFVSFSSIYSNLIVKNTGDRSNDHSNQNQNQNRNALLNFQSYLMNGKASSVKISIKYFIKSLFSILTKPDNCFCGITPNDSCFFMTFQYYDQSLSLHYRLPILD